MNTILNGSLRSPVQDQIFMQDKNEQKSSYG